MWTVLKNESNRFCNWRMRSVSAKYLNCSRIGDEFFYGNINCEGRKGNLAYLTCTEIPAHFFPNSGSSAAAVAAAGVETKVTSAKPTDSFSGIKYCWLDGRADPFIPFPDWRLLREQPFWDHLNFGTHFRLNSLHTNFASAQNRQNHTSSLGVIVNCLRNHNHDTKL